MCKDDYDPTWGYGREDEGSSNVLAPEVWFAGSLEDDYSEDSMP